MSRSTGPVRVATSGLASAMELVSFAGTTVAVAALVVAAAKLWDRSVLYVANAGGLPQPSLDYAMQVARMPGLHLRLMWWALAWVCVVFTAGCAVLAVAGARSLWWRVHAVLADRA